MKRLKMKVSLRRKIHIIALYQGTFLNALIRGPVGDDALQAFSQRERLCGTCLSSLSHVRWACLSDPTNCQQEVQIVS
jgi:hypothetical protein